MREYDSRALNFQTLVPNSDETLWIYNAFDNCMTREIWDVLNPELNPAHTQITYDFERHLLGPTLTAMRRGIKVDLDYRDHLLEEFEPLVLQFGGMQKQKSKKGGKWKVVNEDTPLQQLAREITGEVFNYHSEKQIKRLFYGALKIPEQWKAKKGERLVSIDRDALEKMRTEYPRAAPLCSLMLYLRDLEKQISVLRSGVDPDGRMRFSINVAGTETGRFSSNKNIYGTGMNAQNITEKLRRMFVPDDGMVFLYPDLEQAESRAVAYLAQDEEYIRACESADLHTVVTKMIWPDLPWTGDLKEDKKIAETLYYRDYTHRFMSKKAGHGSNYHGTPRTLGNQMKVEEKIIARFQLLYFGGEVSKTALSRWGYRSMIEQADRIEGDLCYFKGQFPGIRKWQQDIIDKVETDGYLISPVGRYRRFWGRSSDPATHRKAIASLPQGLIADVMNVGVLRVWNELDPDGAEFLMQVHDALLAQCSEDKAEAMGKRVLELMHVPVNVYGREMVIPSEMLIGKNAAKADPKNKLFKDGNPNGVK